MAHNPHADAMPRRNPLKLLWYKIVGPAPCPYESWCKQCERCGRCQSHGRPCINDPAGELIDAEIGKWALERREERMNESL